MPRAPRSSPPPMSGSQTRSRGLLSAIDHASEALKTSREDYDAAHAAFKDAHGRLTWARLELDRRRAMARRKLVSSRPAAIGEFLTWLSEAEQEAKNGLRTWTATSGLLARLTGRPRLVDQSNSEKVDAKLAAICEARDWCQRHVENEFLPLAELEDKLEIFRRDIERMTV